MKNGGRKKNSRSNYLLVERCLAMEIATLANREFRFSIVSGFRCFTNPKFRMIFSSEQIENAKLIN
jgi:hypothetical protein